MLIRRTIKTYDVSQIILRNRIKNYISKIEEYNVQHNLISIEEETFIRHILDLDLREFSSRINDVQDMIDLFRKTRYVQSMNK